MKDAKTILETADDFYKKAIDGEYSVFYYNRACLVGMSMCFESNDPIGHKINEMIDQLNSRPPA